MSNLLNSPDHSSVETGADVVTFSPPEPAAHPQGPAPGGAAASPAHPDGGMSGTPTAPTPEAGAPEENLVRFLERRAEQAGLLPVKLARKTCPIPAESLLRQLGRMARSPEPWLPVGAVGPVLVMGHFRTDETECWGVPAPLQTRVFITEDAYRGIFKDLSERLGYKPLPAESPHENRVPAPPKGEGLKAVLDWFVDAYPMPEVERDKMRRLVQEHGSKPLETMENLDFLPKHHAPAVMFWANGTPIFNPDDAPGQDRFPDALLEKHGVYPLFCGEKRVYLLSSKRSNYAFEDEWMSTNAEAIEMVTVLAEAASIQQAVGRNRGRASRDSGSQIEVGDLYYSEDGNLVEIEPAEMSRINPANPNNTPEQVLHWVLNRALSLRASDLHVEKFYNTARFRARIDGQLHVVHSMSEEELPRYIALIKNWSNMGQERQTLQDARFAMKIGTRRIDVRVSAVPCRKELQKLTMRFLDKQDGIKTLTELNMSDRQAKIVNDAMSRDQGLILVTGPTGSGKTTTLYAFLNSINDEGINIHTIEDPIEYEIEGINQTQTDPFNGIDFAAGLRALLRADPDVMLIGESRDEETATAAINAALTGHLVLTTLHANDSLRAVSRLLSMGIAPYLLADALALSQAQRLVRRLCQYCKHPTPMTREIQDYLHRQGVIHDATDEPLYEQVGCDECHGTGFSGRIALMEMCPVGPDLADLVARGAPVTEMRRVAQAAGVLTLYQEGLRQVAHGLTTFDEIKGVAYTGATDF